ncbi:hypothetical protein [Lysobacter solisilvae (ex Woo and Kim 2020)]|uniref:Lipoprotein n=1 Tax=Agrilutibacter terrestris TaxID=2865112 RepID=A0A7H0FX73_9GAMM|nr:hypothetical protein [Lysobacter terrestris]QNP40639.1 hypothetical protein H8B22_14450 [Lysobacter terrestris]
MKARIAAIPMFALLAVTGAVSAQSDAQPTTTETQTSTLLIERVQEENKAALPARGQTMAQVEAKYGAPSEKLDARGGQKRQWPTINRWAYPTFTVYFEKSRVIDVVANKADANEIGPKPPIK